MYKTYIVYGPHNGSVTSGLFPWLFLSPELTAMSGIFKSTVLKSTPKRPPGPQFGGQNPTLSISGDGKRLPHDPMCLSPEASNPPPLLGGGTADGPSLLDALVSMGANPRSSSLQQVLALLSFVCPSFSTRAVELGWTQEQLIAEMQITGAPQSYVHVTSSLNSSGPADGPPASSATPTSSSSTPFPTLPMSSPEADPQVPWY